MWFARQGVSSFAKLLVTLLKTQEALSTLHDAITPRLIKRCAQKSARCDGITRLS